MRKVSDRDAGVAKIETAAVFEFICDAFLPKRFQLGSALVCDRLQRTAWSTSSTLAAKIFQRRSALGFNIPGPVRPTPLIAQAAATKMIKSVVEALRG